MHLKVSTLGVLSSGGIVVAEVRSLRGMGDNGIRQQSSELLGENDQKVFTTAIAFLEGRSVLPVNVYSVQLVSRHKISQFLSTLKSIIT